MQITPDFLYTAKDPDTALDYIHRRTGDADIYFVRNERPSPAQATLSFRIHGRAPEIWDADTGESRSALIYRETQTHTELPLSFPAFGSTFVIFRRPSTVHVVEAHHDGQQIFPSLAPDPGFHGGPGRASLLQSSQPGTYTISLSNGERHTLQVPVPPSQPALIGPWTLGFPSGWGAPSSVTMPTLQSWTESSIPGVRYFSGTATYTNTLQLPKTLLDGHHEIWMELGDVREVATVTVNGIELRTLWHRPFTLRLDSALHAGENSLSIRVTNLWPNRLIGDKQPNATVHYTHTNVDAYTKDSPLLPSGLLSPVTFQVSTEAAPQQAP
jgi:hypothetical protein